MDRAIAAVLEPLERRTLLSVAVAGIPSWTEQGPGPAHNGSGQGIPNQPVSGAIQAVAVHPSDANIIWVGSVNGGIWKTTDGGTTWSPKTDQFPTLSISTLTLDPTNPNIIWAGTARTTSAGSVGGTAGGLLKSADGGETWAVYPAGLVGLNLGVHAVLPTTIVQETGRVVLAGTDENLHNGGLLRSTDGGNGTFLRISGTADDGEDNDFDNLIDAADPSEQNGLPGGTVDSIVADPANGNRIYVAMRGKGVFVSNNGGGTWTAAGNLESVVGANSSNFGKIQDTIRIDLAASSAAATTGNRPVYAATIVAVKDSLFEAVPTTGTRKTIVVSPNTLIEPGDFIELEKSPTVRERVKVVSRTFGNNVWTLTLETGLTNSYPLNTPVRCFRYDSRTQERPSGVFRSDDNGAHWVFLGIPGDIDGGISPGGQAAKHFSLVADKDDPNLVYVGGDTQPGPHPNSSGGVHNSGRLFQATFNPNNNGATWQPIASTAANGTAPHPDSRAMVMDKFGDIIEVDDGGIYKLSLAGTPFQRWVSLNGNLRLMEFNSVASSNGRILGGAQDNGVSLQSATNDLVWDRLLSGDGEIVRAAGSTQLYSFQNLGGFKINGHHPTLDVIGTGKKLNDVDPVRFNEPYVLNAVDPARMLIGQARLFESVKVPNVPLGDLLMPLGSGNAAVVGSIFPNAMVYGGWEGLANPKPDIGWIGTRQDPRKLDGHNLYIRQSGMYGAFVPVESWAAGSVVAIDVDPTDWREVFVLDGAGHVWYSPTGGEKPDDVGKWTWTSQLSTINELIDLAGTSQFNDIDVARKGDKRAVLVSGLAGVFRMIQTLDVPSNSWVSGPWTRFGGGPIVNGVTDPFGGGLPNTTVSELHLPNDPNVYLNPSPGADDRILAGTHGRGAFTAPLSDTLFEDATVSISGGPGNQAITLRREAARPWILDIFEYAAGSAEPATPSRRIPLASIQEIFIDGGDGSDQITIDYTNGAIDVPNGVAISGGDGAGDSLKIVNTGLEILPDHKLDTVGGQTVSTITIYDGFGRQGVQRIKWDSSIETPPPPAQIAPTSSVQVIGKGLSSASASLRRGTAESIADKKIAGLDGRSLAGALGGLRIEPEEAEQDLGEEGEEAGVIGPGPEPQVDNATSILARLIEEGAQSFSISDIGAPGLIDSMAKLRDALDALDATPGNVTLDTTTDLDADGTPDTKLSVQIVDRELSGLVDVDIDANIALGDVRLIGHAEFDARVDLNIVIGSDGRGFFLKPSSAGTPAIRVSDIKVDGEIGGTGRFGFLGVNLTDGELTVDPDVGIEMSLIDPGIDAADSTIRFPELFPSDYTKLLSVSVKGDPGDGAGNEDVILYGEFGVTSVLGSDETPLFSADAELSFPDLADPRNLIFTPDAGGTLNSMFGIDATALLNQILGTAEQIKQATGVDIFSQKIPLLDQSLDDILGGNVEEVFADDDFLQIGSVFSEGGFNKFSVTLNGISPLERGIAVDNVVTFKGSDDATYTGTIDAADFASFTVKFDPSIAVGPKTGTGASIQVTRQGSTRDMIQGWLGELANPVGLSRRVPTIQDMIAALGLEDEGVRLSDANDAIEIPVEFELDPITFSRHLDFGETIGGLKLTAGGDIDVEISPSFAFTVGVRFTSGVPAAERIYIKEDDDPEMTLAVRVTVDDPTATGHIGFLDVALAEDGDNEGISLTGTLKLNLTDPGSDGRIFVSELTPSNLLSSFEAAIAADFVINPLKITANVAGDSTELGKMTIKLDAADGHVTSLSDLQNLPSKIQITGESNFSNFQNITPEMILAALRALIERLRDMGAGGVLDRKLPVIDKSVSDLLNVADKLAEDLGVLEGNDFSSASKLQTFLQDRLGSAATVTVGSDAIQFRLNFIKHVDESLPFSLNLGDSWGLFRVDADGNVLFAADAEADVSFGLLTGANLDLADRVYFDTEGDDASKVTMTGSANLGYDGGNGFDAHVKLGFFDFDVIGARAFLDATLVGSLIDPDNAGRLTFHEIVDKVTAGDVTDVFDGNFTGRVQARVPLDGDGQGVDASGPNGTPGVSSGDALIEIAGKLENLGNVVFDVDPNLHADAADPLLANQLDAQRLLVYTHNLDNLIANAVLNFDNLIDGLEKLIEWGDKLLGIGVLDFELPFTGKSLRDAVNFFKDPSGPFATIISAINSSDGLGDNPSDTTAMFAAQQINDALEDISGLSPLVEGDDILKFQHLNHDPTQPLTGATFKFRMSVPFSIPITTLDLGLDFFDFNANVALNATGFIDLVVGLGIDKAHDGFYLITDFPELAVDEPEISLRQFRVTAGGNASVDLGFLEMAGVFDPLKNFLQTNLRVNLNGLDDDRLTLSELADFSNLTRIVDRNSNTPGFDGLDLNVSAKVDVPLKVESNPDLPSISTNFVMQWGPFGLDDIRGGTPAFTSPLVELRNLSLSPGEFIEKYSQPFLQTLEQYNVLAPFIDKLDDPLPIIGGTLFDLLVTNNPALSPQERDTAQFLFSIAKTIQDFDDQLDSVDGLFLNFGTVGIRPDQTLDTSNADPTGQADDATPQIQQFPGDHLPGVGGIIKDLGEIGITFPMLNVGSLVQLFMGNNTDLIFADLPELHVGKEFFETIPIYSVGIPYIASATINAVFGGSIDLFVNLSAGLDSSGLSRGLSHVLDGLYIGDFAPGDDHQITSGDEERPEVSLEASVTAGINARASLLGFDILSVTGKASIGGAIGLDLNDDNDNIGDPFDTRDAAARNDGKFYLPEIQEVINSAGGDAFCMFDIVGEVFAKLGFEVHVPYAPNPDWSHRWTLVKFDIECEPSPPLTPDFADVIGSQLVFTSSLGTSHADLHSRAATNHPDGDPIEVFLVDEDGDADNGDETLRIRKFGSFEDFGPLESGNNHLDSISELTQITDRGDGSLKFKLTDFGAGNDSVLIDSAIRIRVRLAGGDGDDTLTGGDGGGTLLGGAGNDTLAFAPAPASLTESERLLRSSSLVGNEGDDQLFGTVGNDILLGGEGNDTMDGGGSGGSDDVGRDVLVGGGGDDVLDGRGAADTLVGDYDSIRAQRPPGGLDGSDFISGGGGGDLIWGDNRGNSDVVDGPAANPAVPANDYIYAGADSDLVFGGSGDDLIETGLAGTTPSVFNRAYGGIGNDSITGGDGRDSLVGNAGNDTITGRGANDLLYAGDDVFGPNASNLGFDLLAGGVGDDLLDGSDANSVTASGDAGTDSILGSRGNDDLSGGADRDFIMAGPGSDLVSGGEANDDIVGGDGSVDTMTFDFTEADGADSISGDAGDDVLLGDNGTINSSTRAVTTTDTGGSGADTVTGAAGSDSIFGGGAGDQLGGGSEADLLVGDFGSINRALPANANFTSTSTTSAQGGNDVIHGDSGDDTAIGGQGADQIFGDDDSDDLIGGHNIAGGNDGGDDIDGGAGHDAIAGDNASIVRRSDSQSRNTRALAGTTLYSSAGAANVTSTLQSSVDAVPGRDITLLDHTATTGAALFGDDNLAGGAGHDSVFGQLGNDRIQGDGGMSLNISATQPSTNAATDGNDYMEGGGGGDLMFGNLGQDDLIGGSSSLFGLTTTSMRPDGADVIYGGAGTAASRNDVGDTTPGGHARDADVIMGDNANVYRILSGNGASTYGSFAYDDYAGGIRVIPRAVDLLDYSADGNSANDTGAGDILQGEGSDDSVHGMSGNDYALGDGQDDHVFGESGDDWLDGGTGDDAMLGDEGKILTSRNGKAEPLYGLAATTQSTASVSSISYSATLYTTGQLSHTVDLEPFAIGGADVMYGGLGNDAMHGGAGQDLMSGAEALPEFFKPAVIPTLVFMGEKFATFDYNNPLVRIAGHPLNFEAFTGTAANIINDGNDALFGDAGNDWLVGGTQTDRLYGGYGNDVLNTDDNVDTSAGANNTPDTAPYEGADLAFGGAGRDIFVGNAPTDRLIDWVGEFNNYYVPFNPFGQSTVIRQISQQIIGFLYAVSRSDGADRTRVGTGLGTAARNGEPFGELGLVTPQDADWNAQNGPPVGPQPQ